MALLVARSRRQQCRAAHPFGLVRWAGVNCTLVSDLLRNAAFFPVLRDEFVLRFCADMHASSRKVKIRPMQRLELSAAQPACKCQCKKGPFPVVTRGEEFFQITVWIGHRLFPKSRKAGN